MQRSDLQYGQHLELFYILPEDALLAQGALLGTKVLTIKDIRSRVAGRYPAAQPIPDRPHLDELIDSIGMGFTWDGSYQPSEGPRGGYCLPIAGLTMMASKTKTQYHFTAIGETDTTGMHEIELLEKGFSHFVQVVRDQLNVDVDIPLAGAAGGLGAGLLAFTNAKLHLGADIIAEEIHLSRNTTL